MNQFTIDQIMCFQAVIDEGSFNRAAEKLHRAKSAVRYGVDKLEEQLGFPVLDRSSYRPSMTPQGEEFLARAKRLLSEYRSLQLASEQIGCRVETRLALSVSGIYGTNKLYPTIKKAIKEFPSTEIIIEREILSGEKMLLAGSVDMAVSERLQNKNEIDYKEIDKVNLLLVLASDHPFLSLPKADQNFEALYKYPQIITRSTIPDDSILAGVHEKALKWHVTDTPSKKEIILNGLGWGRLPEDLVSKEINSGKLTRLDWLEGDEEVVFYLCRKKGASAGTVAQFIWDSF